jgi:branched-chain amino acid transport system substrate-binding protein
VGNGKGAGAWPNVPSRRSVVGMAALGMAAGTAGVVAAPGLLRSQPAPVRIGLLHSVTGALAAEGSQARAGALLAIEAINAAGGIATLGGARLEPLLGDAQSRAELAAAEVDKLVEAGAVAILGPASSGIAMSTTQSAARHGVPHVVDAGASDLIVQRGLTNTFRFAPGASRIAQATAEMLGTINEAAGRPTRTVTFVHDDTVPRAAIVRALYEEMPKRGFEVGEVIALPSGAVDVTDVVQRVRGIGADLLLFSCTGPDAIALLATLQRERVAPKAVVSVLGPLTTAPRILRDHGEIARHLIECGNWFDPRRPRSAGLVAAASQRRIPVTGELMLNHACLLLIADAIGRAASVDRARLVEALASSTFDDHVMPYGPTRFQNGQNQGAQPTLVQLMPEGVAVIGPPAVAETAAIFPLSRG